MSSARLAVLRAVRAASDEHAAGELRTAVRARRRRLHAGAAAAHGACKVARFCGSLGRAAKKEARETDCVHADIHAAAIAW